MHSKKNQPYHHGNLRAALLAAAAEIISEKGVDNLTLRGLSQSIGVSRTAPYRHFKDKAALLAAVAQEGFNRLYQQFSEASEKDVSDAAAQVQSMGTAYVMFAVENPTHYQLMMSCGAENERLYPDLETVGRRVFDLLVETIATGQSQSSIKTGDPLQLAYVAWATVHGLASLLIDNQLQDVEDVRALAVLATKTLVEGMRPSPDSV